MTVYTLWHIKWKQWRMPYNTVLKDRKFTFYTILCPRIYEQNTAQKNYACNRIFSNKIIKGNLPGVPRSPLIVILYFDLASPTKNMSNFAYVLLFFASTKSILSSYLPFMVIWFRYLLPKISCIHFLKDNHKPHQNLGRIQVFNVRSLLRLVYFPTC